MTELSIASVVRIQSIKKAGDFSFKTIASFCCIGLMASLCLTTMGIDLGAGWM